MLDIGSAKISCAILKFDRLPCQTHPELASDMQSRLQILGSATVASRGVRSGEVRNQRSLAETIMRVLTKVQSQVGVRVDHAFVCTSGGAIDGSILHNTVRINGSRIDSDDIARVVGWAELPELPSGRTYLSIQPIGFAVDHRIEIADPRNMSGNSLSVDLHAVSADSATVKSIDAAVRKCNLSLCGIMPTAHAAALSALVEGEQNLGAACVDIGAGVTSLAVYYNRNVVYSRTIGVGGRYVTTDICNALSVSESQAEWMKTVHGNLYFEPRDDEERIAFDTLDGSRKSVSRAQLTFFIKPRIEEILEEVRNVLTEIDFDCLPGRSIVLTGGGSQMQDLDGMARAVLGPHVRFGMPVRLSGLPQPLSGPQCSALVGACLDAMLPQTEFSDLPAHQTGPGRKNISRTLSLVCGKLVASASIVSHLMCNLPGPVPVAS